MGFFDDEVAAVGDKGLVGGPEGEEVLVEVGAMVNFSEDVGLKALKEEAVQALVCFAVKFDQLARATNH